MDKYFIITVDTEGDNLWAHKDGDDITTENAKYIPPFQELCNEFGFKPVYLANYEMLQDKFFVDYAKKNLKKNTCEVGLHLHAWNNPPIYNLERVYKSNPYLIEYPKDIMRKKFDCLYRLFVEKFEITPISHRAGRWYMDEHYFMLLKEYGVIVDCSVTPGHNWSTNTGATISHGPDYSREKLEVSYKKGVMEVPVTVCKFHFIPDGSFKHKIKIALKGQEVWLRTSHSRLCDIFKLVRHIENTRSDLNYLEFMIHSSELMPGGSAFVKTEADVERHLQSMKQLFSFLQNRGYKGITLKEYYDIMKNY